MRTPSEHKIDTFSLREDGRKDTREGTDSLNYVDFVVCVETRVLGTGESYYVLPSHLSRGARIETYGGFVVCDTCLSHLSRGARIETSPSAYGNMHLIQSHLSRGARIETSISRNISRRILSHLSRGARIETAEAYSKQSHLSLGARIETLRPDLVPTYQ